VSESQAPPALHTLERDVMEEVWERGEASVREVMDALNGRGGTPRAYTTYMTIMARLARKRLLDRRRSGKTDLYRPVYTREEYANRRAQAAVQSLVDEYGGVALVHIARQMAQLDPSRRRALERLAAGAEEERRT
jgi:BlaI family transcriptional regulator, penicillinase repressor